MRRAIRMNELGGACVLSPMEAILKRSCLVCLAFALLFARASEAGMDSYQEAATKCDQEIQTQLGKLWEEYGSELDSLQQKFQQQGDLDNTLAIRKEKERFAAERKLEQKNVVELPVELRELQQKYLAAPKKTTESIAKTYVISLEETKKKLTIDGKLDEALGVQGEIAKILKKYNIANPVQGSALGKSDLPKYVSMTQSLSFPIIVDGQQVGVMGLTQGESYKLIRVDGTQVSIRVGNSIVTVPVDATDLLPRIERAQKASTSEDEGIDGGKETAAGEESSATHRPETAATSTSLFDAGLWITYKPFSDSDVVFEDSRIILENRGRLLSKAGYVSYEISGRFAFVGSRNDSFVVCLRTDGKSNNRWGAFDNGIYVHFEMQNDTGDTSRTLGISKVSSSGSADRVESALGTKRIPISPNEPIDFRIIDTGKSIRLYLGSDQTPLLAVNENATFGHRIGLNNREGTGGGSSISAGSIVEITALKIGELK